MRVCLTGFTRSAVLFEISNSLITITARHASRSASSSRRGRCQPWNRDCWLRPNPRGWRIQWSGLHSTSTQEIIPAVANDVSRYWPSLSAYSCLSRCSRRAAQGAIVILALPLPRKAIRRRRRSRSPGHRRRATCPRRPISMPRNPRFPRVRAIFR